MADIITHYEPPYINDGGSPPAPMKQKWVDNGDSYARSVQAITAPAVTATGNVIYSIHEPPYLSDGEATPGPMNQYWIDQGDYYTRRVTTG